MITHGRGQLCMPILPEVSKRLKLAPMVEDNTAPLGTNYTIPVDHRTSRTGITAGERSTTIARIVRPQQCPPPISIGLGICFRWLRSRAASFAARDIPKQPSTWRAWPAWIPRARCAKFLTSMATAPHATNCTSWPPKHKLPIISIEQLIAHRRVREKLVYRQAEAKLPTKYGHGKIIAYGVKYESQEPLVYVIGDPSKVAAPLVRLHSSCFTGDLMESLRCDCGDQLHMALDMIGREGCGVLVYLPQEGRGIGLVEKIKAYKLQDEGLDTVEANVALGFKADSRDYGVGIQLLKDLGLTKVRLLTNNPKKTDAFIYGGFDLEVVDQVPIVPPMNEHNAEYLATKRDKMGHRLPPE